ncbi:hypothetical protein EG68_11393 [Paragonimus skrjabini miyazakii]|uniref:Uncharacterized protein n=1 Tax=Paragonimus skrjabini miyazakii TaxID=59628 RepID=A0A8S9YJK5_9TREM|nr:hypothetical protein EG68_11393 [Paragonimus skrjabini miyazakii]
MHLILLVRLLLQLVSIKMNFTRDCELPGAIQHVITLLVGVFSLIHSVIVLVVSRTLTPQQLLLKTCLVIYVLSGVACTTLYLSDLSDYDYINCLPDRMLYTLTWPSVALFASSALFLSLYWIFRPYQNMDEWFGELGNVVLNLFIWSSLTVDSGISRYATTAVIRLTNMNLIHAFLSSVYHGIFKWSTLQFYWRLAQIIHYATLKQVTTVTSTMRGSCEETVEDRPVVEERLELTVLPNTEELAVGLFKTESKLTRKKRRIGHRPTVNLRAATSRLDDFSSHVRYRAYRRPTMRHMIRLDGETRLTRTSRARFESS